MSLAAQVALGFTKLGNYIRDTVMPKFGLRGAVSVIMANKTSTITATFQVAGLTTAHKVFVSPGQLPVANLTFPMSAHGYCATAGILTVRLDFLGSVQGPIAIPINYQALI